MPHFILGTENEAKKCFSPGTDFSYLLITGKMSGVANEQTKKWPPTKICM